MGLSACIGVSDNAIADKEMQHGCSGDESVFPLNSMVVSRPSSLLGFLSLYIENRRRIS